MLHSKRFKQEARNRDSLSFDAHPVDKQDSNNENENSSSSVLRNGHLSPDPLMRLPDSQNMESLYHIETIATLTPVFIPSSPSVMLRTLLRSVAIALLL